MSPKYFLKCFKNIILMLLKCFSKCFYNITKMFWWCCKYMKYNTTNIFCRILKGHRIISHLRVASWYWPVLVMARLPQTIKHLNGLVWFKFWEHTFLFISMSDCYMMVFKTCNTLQYWFINLLIYQLTKYKWNGHLSAVL